MKSPTALLAILAALALSACEPSASEMGTLTGKMPEAPPAIVVRDVPRHLDVALHDGALSETDRARIEEFLRAAATRPENAHLAVAGASSEALGFVVRAALAQGYRGDNIAVSRNGRPGTLVLATRVYEAVLPNCSQTQHLNLIDSDNMVSSDWGCATVSMFDLQVADPRDLARGRDGGMTDSIMTTAAIKRLQTDKLKKLDASSSTTSVSGGGGGGQ